MADPKPPENKELDARALARRQRDLDGFVDKMDEILDNRDRKYSGQLKGMYTEIAMNLNREMQKLYKKIQALNGEAIAGNPVKPEKLASLLAQVDHLDRLKEQIAALTQEKGQIELLERDLQFSYAHGYYYSAFGLEQAARVSVVAPVLTQAQVLGVIVNPWLPDRRTYSDRIRRNTSLLASAMQESMLEAVGQGWGWNRLARRIQDKVGESYFNAVRLARTERTRASSQGATALYLQNADIMDGKRWNATLDSATAPKDAANDGELYELDYDTPENPGKPGERIPNHPNCRCKWSPLLSALGVSTRERIARDQDGKRIYTKARTYKEYAKEVGLPDLDERLARDDPKKYLRPGETGDEGKSGRLPKTAPGTPQPKPPAPLPATDLERLKALAPKEMFNDPTEADAFYKSMAGAPPEMVSFALRNWSSGVKEFKAVGRGSFYRPGPESSVNMSEVHVKSLKDAAKDSAAYREAKGTLVHEIGHGLDCGAYRLIPSEDGKPRSKVKALSDHDETFVKAVDGAKEKYKALKKQANPNRLKTVKKADTRERVTKEITAAKAQIDSIKENVQGRFLASGMGPEGVWVRNLKYAGLSDIIDGITDGEISGGFGHSVKYWKESGHFRKEVFTNLFELSVHNEADALNWMRETFPEIVQAFDDLIRRF